MKLQQFQHFIIMHLYRCFNFHSVFLSPLYFVFSDPRQGCLLRHKTKKRQRTREVMKRKLTRRWRRKGGKRRRGLILRLLRPPPSSLLFSVFPLHVLFFLSLSVYFLACFLFAFLMLARVLLLVHAIKIKMKWNEKFHWRKFTLRFFERKTEKWKTEKLKTEKLKIFAIFYLFDLDF